MMYAVYDETGRITQASQVYDPNTSAEDIMRDLGQKWVKQDRELVSSDEFYVSHETLTERPYMHVSATKKVIQAGDNDSTVIRGYPKGSRCIVSTSNHVLHDFRLDDDELELSIPVPCIYKVHFILWPYRDVELAIEAVS